VPQKKVKEVLSVSSLREDNLPLGTESIDVEEKHKVNTVKVHNSTEGRVYSKVKLKKSAATTWKKNSYPGKTDNNLEQAHGITIANKNERPQKHFTEGNTDGVKNVCLSNVAWKNKKSVEVCQCHICNKTFPNHRKLNVHVAVHLSLPEFQCDKCSKKFRSKFSLR
jgi:hypothetical protein